MDKHTRTKLDTALEIAEEIKGLYDEWGMPVRISFSITPTVVTNIMLGSDGLFDIHCQIHGEAAE